jgi:glycosyltransferase involved in cell wall biosynthesis
MAERTSTSPAPRVSVIVPVRDRRELLGKLLDCLAVQTVTDHEVIVVDDASTDGSEQEAECRARSGQPIVVLAGAGNGAVEARCLGVAEARADVLAFTDSDCQPAPNWLERGLAAVAAGADVVQGRTEPTTIVRPLERSIWVTGEDGLYATCNIFYRRKAYERASIGFSSGSDVAGSGHGRGHAARLAGAGGWTQRVRT